MDSASALIPAGQTPESRGLLASFKHLESTVNQQHATIQSLQSTIKQKESQLNHHDDQLKQLSEVIKQQHAKIAHLETELPHCQHLSVQRQTEVVIPEPRILDDKRDYWPWIYYMNMKLAGRDADKFTDEEEFWYIFAHLGKDLQRRVTEGDLMDDKDLDDLRRELEMWSLGSEIE